jgi:multisubunit Na+/H+ antiporter MnhB subunit
MLDASLDLVLALAIVWVGWRVVASADLFTAVILFIVFGLLMSLAWVRLEAPDIALAEAAIGAGLTGALMLDAVRQLEGRAARPPGALAAALATILLATPLVLVVVGLPQAPGGLTSEALARLDESGVAHPVTAVLLNFRGYDTWLEVAVLLAAVLGVLAVRRARDFTAVALLPADDPVLGGMTRMLVPALVLAGGYLLWLGTAAPGGAFQAGAVLGAAGALLLLAGYRSITALRGRMLSAALLAGVGAFLGLAVVLLLAGRRLLEYPPALAGPLIVAVEVAVTVAIGVTLAALFAGARIAAPRASPSSPRSEPTGR